MIGKIKIGTPKHVFMDEFICLRSKSMSFKCGRFNKKILKGISKPQSRKIKFEA